MSAESASTAIDTLKQHYAALDWRFATVCAHAEKELMFEWPGEENEDIIITVRFSDPIDEPFHYHDYFYFNYAYEGGFGSVTNDRSEIFVRENEVYVGQPFSGHAMKAHDNEAVSIIGVLIRKEAMIRRVLPQLSPTAKLLRFLVQPETEEQSDKFFHVAIREPARMRRLLELMAMEYDAAGDGVQDILASLSAAFLMQLSRNLQSDSNVLLDASPSRTDAIVRYIQQQSCTTSLSAVASEFGYSPTYLSGLLKEEAGKTFSQIVTEERMNRAALLLEGTDLSIEQISNLLGYSSSSSFYRAHRRFFGRPPRQQPTIDKDGESARTGSD